MDKYIKENLIITAYIERCVSIGWDIRRSFKNTVGRDAKWVVKNICPVNHPGCNCIDTGSDCKKCWVVAALRFMPVYNETIRTLKGSCDNDE